MEHRALGRTGLTVSLLGLGTVKLGRREGVRYPADFRLPDDRSAASLLDLAKDLGMNLIDTAPAYGSSEARLGKLLRRSRDHWLIATKVGEEFSRGRSRFDFSPTAVETSVARSLARLRTDRLDIVLIHSDGRDRQILEELGTLDALKDLKRRGLIRAVGISHKTVDGAERAVALGCDVIMATLNRDDVSQLPAIRAAAAAGCGVLVKKALASGHAPADSLRLAAAEPSVSSVVVGTIDPAHLKQNATLVESLSGS
jgi:aryl-alcohol dehydrogenase-like predicted oxidoreductase